MRARLSFTVVLECEIDKSAQSPEQIMEAYKHSVVDVGWRSEQAPKEIKAIYETLLMTKIDFAPGAPPLTLA